MAKLKFTYLALLSLSLVSCVPPKAIVVAELPVLVKAKTPDAAVAHVPEAPISAQKEDLRMPDLLTLPNEEELRSSGSSKLGPDDGAVTVRPPTDPPSRVKAKE
jgi:hypothetical protein